MSKSKNIFAAVFLIAVSPILRLIYHVKYVGRENVPQSGGFIMASNHLLALDPFKAGYSPYSQV